MSKLVIDMPGNLDDYQDFFDVVDFLENKDELIKEFKPEVEKYMVREDFFQGPFRLAYRNAFDELIVRLIKSQIIKHFPNLTPEQVMQICEPDTLKLLTEDYYFNPDSYRNLN